MGKMQLKLRDTVNFLSSVNPRPNHKNTQSLDKIAEFLKTQFIQMGLKDVTFQSYKTQGSIYHNVVGSINTTKTERIILGAHYDTFQSTPGADDNASGVAGLLETARQLVKLGYQGKYRIDVVAYPLEEPPFFKTQFMGSYVHASNLHKTNTRVKAMICLEMIGYFTNQPNSQNFPMKPLRWIYPSTGDFIALVGLANNLLLLQHFNRALNRRPQLKSRYLPALSFIKDIDESDHLNYWKFNYPALMVTDTGRYRNPHYHQLSDTVETLDFNKMEQIVLGLTQAICDL